VQCHTEVRRLQEEEERKQREEEERKAQEERERLQAIEDARFAEEKAALDVWLVHQKDCFEDWKYEEWKEKQVRPNIEQLVKVNKGRDIGEQRELKPPTVEALAPQNIYYRNVLIWLNLPLDCEKLAIEQAMEHI